jgi:hypothetical protein
MSGEARARFEAAQQKLVAGDGKGCLKELDAHDALDPDHKSSDPKAGLAMVRSQCVMMAGKCDAGKTLARKSLEATATMKMGPEQLDKVVEAYATQWCQGGSMSDRDQLLQTLSKLQNAAYMTHKDVAFCDEQWAKAKKLIPKVKPKDNDDSQIINVEYSLYSMVPLCYERAGDCKKAYASFPEVTPKKTKEGLASLDADQREKVNRSSFESLVRNCKDK